MATTKKSEGGLSLGHFFFNHCFLTSPLNTSLSLLQELEQTLENRSDAPLNQFHSAAAAAADRERGAHETTDGNLKEVGKGYFPPPPIRKL